MVRRIVVTVFLIIGSVLVAEPTAGDLGDEFVARIIGVVFLSAGFVALVVRRVSWAGVGALGMLPPMFYLLWAWKVASHPSWTWPLILAAGLETLLLLLWGVGAAGGRSRRRRQRPHL